MKTIVIEGEHRLSGTVQISGAKNSAAALMPATLLVGERCVLEGLPKIGDVGVLRQILTEMGARIVGEEDRLSIDCSGPIDVRVPYSLAKKVRASALFLGPLVARFGRAHVAFPGGCDIGSRPLDLHLKGLSELGVRVEVQHGYIIAEAERLRGEELYLDFPSVGATENIMMAACLAEGVTTIYNAAKEPEVVDLANFLCMMGAEVRGAGTDIIRIKGVPELHGAVYSVIPDRIEAGTYLIATLATGGSITLQNVIPKHLESVISKLQEAGAEITVGDDYLQAQCNDPLRPITVKTLPYPGFPTDLQPQLTSLLMRAEGTSIINERIFENRFRHVDELKRLGAQIKADGNTCVVEGVCHLTGAPVCATDLRMAAALVIAGLFAEGETLIEGAEHLLRGYEDMPGKLSSLGGRVYLLDEGGH